MPKGRTTGMSGHVPKRHHPTAAGRSTKHRGEGPEPRLVLLTRRQSCGGEFLGLVAR